MNLWMYGLGQSPQETIPRLRAAGVSRVFCDCSADLPERVREAGMEPWVCLGAFPNVDQTTLSRGVDGQDYLWFGSGCPNNARIRERGKAALHRAVRSGVQGVFVDGARFASPCSAENIAALFTCFCDDCLDHAQRLGLDAQHMLADTRRLYQRVSARQPLPWQLDSYRSDYPGVLSWLRFRALCIGEYMQELSAIAHGAGKQFGAFVFTPSLAALVGQEYAAIAPYVDVLSPMIYRAYDTAAVSASCLNHEYAALCRLPGAGLPGREGVRRTASLFGVDLGDAPDAQAVLAGVPEALVVREACTARDRTAAHASTRVAPIYDLRDAHTPACIRAARQCGVQDAMLYHFDEGAFADDIWRAMTDPAV